MILITVEIPELNRHKASMMSRDVKVIPMMIHTTSVHFLCYSESAGRYLVQGIKTFNGRARTRLEGSF